MWKAERLFTAIRYGFDLEHLYVRLDPDTTLETDTADLRIDCWLQTPAHSYRLELSLSSPDHYVVCRRCDDGTWQQVSRSERVAWDDVIELAVPFKELHIEPGHRLNLTLLVQGNGLEIGRYPRHEAVTITVPGPEFEATVWRV